MTVRNYVRVFGCRWPVLLTPAVVGGCARGILDPHGPVGESERLILYDATALMLAVVIPVILCTLVFAWWFRSDNPHALRRPNWEYSGRIEFVTWSIPALLVVFLSGIAWIGSHDLDPPKPISSAATPVEIEVVSLDWKWLFIYPAEQVAAVNEMVIPVNVPVHFKLTSGSVMNSFFVPQLGSQIYTMAGMVTQLNLMASASGSYEGISAQFSGEGFSDMHFAVRAVSPDSYQEWLVATHRAYASLDAAQYALLSHPSVAEPPSVYGAVTAGFFDAIVENHGALLGTPGDTERTHRR